jgi:hypothetical protein
VQAGVYRTGLTVLAQPELPEVEYFHHIMQSFCFQTDDASIVFVHGLQGHPRNTWTREAVASQSAGRTSPGTNNRPQTLQRPRRFSFTTKARSDEKEVFWPAELLPYDCPNARIMTWGYDSDVSKFFGGPANQGNIFTHAKDLLYALSRERTSCVRMPVNFLVGANTDLYNQSGRPLIFVAHSLGGV